MIIVVSAADCVAVDLDDDDRRPRIQRLAGEHELILAIGLATLEPLPVGESIRALHCVLHLGEGERNARLREEGDEQLAWLRGVAILVVRQRQGLPAYILGAARARLAQLVAERGRSRTVH